MEKMLTKVSKFASFAYVSCGDILIQFIDFGLLEPKLLIRGQTWSKSELLSIKKTTRANQNPSITVLIFDSVSRTHFYRSMPKTTDMLRQINQRNHRFQQKSYSVFDFELMNAMYHRTLGNLGYLFWSNFSNINDTMKASLPIGMLFRHFKSRGEVNIVVNVMFSAQLVIISKLFCSS